MKNVRGMFEVVGTKSMQKQHQYEEPRSSGNKYTNSLVVKLLLNIMGHDMVFVR